MKGMREKMHPKINVATIQINKNSIGYMQNTISYHILFLIIECKQQIGSKSLFFFVEKSTFLESTCITIDAIFVVSEIANFIYFIIVNGDDFRDFELVCEKKVIKRNNA